MTNWDLWSARVHHFRRWPSTLVLPCLSDAYSNLSLSLRACLNFSAGAKASIRRGGSDKAKFAAITGAYGENFNAV